MIDNYARGSYGYILASKHAYLLPFKLLLASSNSSNILVLHQEYELVQVERMYSHTRYAY